LSRKVFVFFQCLSSLAPESPEVLFWHRLTQVVTEKKGRKTVVVCGGLRDWIVHVLEGCGSCNGARRELLDFLVQKKINRDRHTDHPAGRHSIRTNQCPPPSSRTVFYRPDALPAAQPTVSKH